MNNSDANYITERDEQQSEAQHSADKAEAIRKIIADSKRPIVKLATDKDWTECRHIELETFAAFEAGYLSRFIHPSAPNTMPTPRFIFPLGDANDPPSFNAILSPSGREQAKNSDRFEHKNKCLTAGQKLLFNPSALKEKIVVVVEGEFDCVSLWQANHKSKEPLDTGSFDRVGFCALGGAGIFNDLIKRLSAMEVKPKIIILFDKDKDAEGNDGAGIINGRKLKDKLLAMHVLCSIQFFEDVMTVEEKEYIGKKPDANAILCSKGEDFLFWRLNRLVKRAVADFKQLEDEFARAKEYKQEQAGKSPLDDYVPPPARKQSSTAGGNYSDEAKRAAIEKLADDIINTVTAEMLEQKGIITHSARGKARPKGYECNFCGSGTKNEKTGVLDFTPSAPTAFYCRACHEGGNVIQFLSKVWNIDNHGKSYFELIQKIADTFGFSYDPSIFEPPRRFSRQQYSEHLAELQAQPQSSNRDEEIRAAIRDACDWRTTKDANGNFKRIAIKATFPNLQFIFDNDPALDGVIGYDEFQCADVIRKCPPWRNNNQCVGTEWTDRDDAQLRMYLRQHYGELSNREFIQDFIVGIAQQNSFHPVKDYFRNLPKWDGEHRAETFFIKFLRVADTPFAREVTRKWLLAAVARVFNPGCRFQLAIVLHGRQGVGKTFVLEKLGGRWYGVLSDDVDDPHAIDAIQNLWIVEFKEFKAARKADVNSVKAFVDTPADNRRPPYARRAVKTPRHCVFAITVNDDQFLTDDTGNRRFPILQSESAAGTYVDELTDKHIDQLWAEVFQQYNELFKDEFNEKKLEKALELSRDAKRKVEAVAQNFMRDDGLANEIKGYLDTPIPRSVIWHTFTKEDRHKFHADGRIFIGGGKQELETRIKNRKRNKSTINADVTELYTLLSAKNEGKIFRNAGEAGLYIYGTELRQHISISEVLNEAFAKGDKRANNYRVAAVLASLEDWHVGERLQNADPVYPDVRKPYFRNAAQVDEPSQDEKQSEPTNDTPHDDFVGEQIDMEDPPF